MHQAAALDLTSTRTRFSTTAWNALASRRPIASAMIQQMGRLMQQVCHRHPISAVSSATRPCCSFCSSLASCLHFSARATSRFFYAKNFRQTPVRRQMDYLRQVGGSKEAAKELKLFNLSEYLTGRFTALSQQIYEENVASIARRLIWGGLLAIMARSATTAPMPTSSGAPSRATTASATSTLITTAIMQAMRNIQQVFSTASGVADQALFLTDLLAFFEMKPRVESKPDGLCVPRPILQGFEFRDVSLRLSWLDPART